MDHHRRKRIWSRLGDICDSDRLESEVGIGRSEDHGSYSKWPLGGSSETVTGRSPETDRVPDHARIAERMTDKPKSRGQLVNLGQCDRLFIGKRRGIGRNELEVGFQS